MLNVYTCTDHDGFFPVGVASIIVAKDKRQGKKLLDKELVKNGLRPFSKCNYTLQKVDIQNQQAIVLRDGNY